MGNLRHFRDRGFAAHQCGEALPHRQCGIDVLEATPPNRQGRQSLPTIKARPVRRSLTALGSGKAAFGSCPTSELQQRLQANEMEMSTTE